MFPPSLRGPAFPFSLFVTALFLAGGCAPSESQAADASPEEHDEPPTVQVTVRDRGYELFIEYPTPAVDAPIELVTHVTDLVTAEPRRAGPVIFRFLSEDGREVRHEDPTPARDGIYLPEIRFPEEGAWEWWLEIPGEGLTTTIALPPIRVYRTHEDAESAPCPAEPEGISFLKEQQWRLGTRIEPVAVATLTERAAFPATVRALPALRARVAPPVAGTLVVPPGGGGLRPGREVEAGELLAWLRPPFSELAVKLLEAEAEVERTRLAVELATSARDRVAALAEEGARSAREREEAEFALHTAQAAHRAATTISATLRRGGFVFPGEEAGFDPTLPLFELRAPIAGRLVGVHAAIGEYVDERRTVVEILDTRRVMVEARLRPEDLTRLGSLDAPILRSLRSAVGPARPLELFEPRLISRGLEADPETQTLPYLYEVGNESGELAIGMAMELLLPVGETVNAPVLPFSALVDENGESVVYVQLAGETFEKHHVELGARDDERVQILAGVEAGEWVVTEGAYAVRLASASGAASGHGHGH